MRATALLMVVVGLAAGCAAETTAADDGPPIGRVATVDMPAEADHDDHHTDQPPQEVASRLDLDGPGTVGLDLITTGLEDQGRAVVDIGVETTRHRSHQATVRVAVTHTGRDRAHTSIYELTLARAANGWRLVDFQVVQ